MGNIRMPSIIWVLMIAQALSMSATPLFFLTGGIIGHNIGPRPGLATLPIAMIILGMAVAVIPATRLMRKLGRKTVFIAGTLIGAIAASLAAWALSQEDFAWFCVASMLVGASSVIAQQYRFAAIEAVGPVLAGRAASRVLLGGLLSAYLGPELVVWGPNISDFLGISANYDNHAAFIGAYMLLAVICLSGLLVILMRYRNTVLEVSVQHSEGRSLKQIFRNPLIWLAIVAASMGYAMMSFVMTATPLNMHAVDGYSLLDTKWVIQSHIIAMFAPAFFSGWLIGHLGHWKVISLGAVAYTICLIIALSGHQLLHYWWSMVLLGIGWNFMFVGGTALLPFCHRASERYKVQSVNEFSVFGIQAVAALSSGWVVNRYGWNTLIGLSAVMVILVITALWLNRSKAQAMKMQEY